MTTIEDKIRKLDYEDKAPDIKPTLKHTMFDFHPDKSKKFKLEHTKELDRDFKDGKAKTFKEDTNIKMFGDSTYKKFTSTKSHDPFETFFGYKHTERPNRYLDGYYLFNMKGKDNTFYMKDNLLREEGNRTELDSRLQAHAEFMQLYDIQKGHYDKVSTEVERRITAAAAREKGGRAGGGSGMTPVKATTVQGEEVPAERAARIEVEKAQRRKATTDRVNQEYQAEYDAKIRDYEDQKIVPDNFLGIADDLNAYLTMDPDDTTPAMKNTINKMIKKMGNRLNLPN
jgi:hypothetical protein